MKHNLATPILRRALGPCALLAALSASATAQFSPSDAVDLAIAGQTYEEAQPKIAVTDDGGFYVSWYANDPGGSPAGGYDVRLQRFNAFGQAEWAAGGLLVADRGFSSTQDYGLATDDFSNALLTFRDDRFGGTQITASMVTPAGLEVWGANGVQLTNTTDFVAAPKICAATDAHVFVGWTQNSSLRMQRLDLSGAKTWATDLVLTPGTGSYSISDLHTSDNGSAIFAWVNQTGGFTAPKHLFANKVSPAKLPLWGAGHVAVFDGGSLQFGNFPTFVGDGAGGACFAWYSSSPALEVWAQRVDANGNELFPHNGVSASTNAGQLRVAPALAFDPAEQELFVAYTELNLSQSQTGLSAQKFDAAGTRQWGPTGVNPVPVGVTQIGDVGAASLHVGKVEGLAITYTTSAGFAQDQLHAFRIADDGTNLGAPTTLSSTLASKYRNTTVATPQGNVIAVWQDDASGSQDVLGQNLLPDGDLGGVPSVTQLLGSGANPVALGAVSGPRIGQTWALSVDKSADPGALATAIFVYAQAAPAPIVIPEGEILVDISSPLILTNIATGPAGVNTHVLSVPAVIDFVGLTVNLQAALAGGTGGTLLTNGLQATLGL